MAKETDMFFSKKKEKNSDELISSNFDKHPYFASLGLEISLEE